LYLSPPPCAWDFIRHTIFKFAQAILQESRGSYGRTPYRVGTQLVEIFMQHLGLNQIA